MYLKAHYNATILHDTNALSCPYHRNCHQLNSPDGLRYSYIRHNFLGIFID